MTFDNYLSVLTGSTSGKGFGSTDLGSRLLPAIGNSFLVSAVLVVLNLVVAGIAAERDDLREKLKARPAPPASPPAPIARPTAAVPVIRYVPTVARPAMVVRPVRYGWMPVRRGRHWVYTAVRLP